MQVDTNKIVALMRRNGMGVEADAVLRGEAIIGAVCDIAFNGQNPAAAQQALDKPADCNCHKKPGMTPMTTGGVIPGINMGLLMPGCYNCTTVDPCLEPYLIDQALQIDAWSIIEMAKNESPLVHLDKIAGAAPFQTDTTLAANEVVLLAQEDGQQLAWIPGVIKVKVKFSDGEDHGEDLKFQFYAGPRNLTGLTDTTALTTIGKAFTYDDFVCGTSCWLVKWPTLFNCSNTVMPGPRSAYVKVMAGALPDGVTVESLTITVIKAHTELYSNCCTAGKLNNPW